MEKAVDLFFLEVPLSQHLFDKCAESLSIVLARKLAAPKHEADARPTAGNAVSCEAKKSINKTSFEVQTVVLSINISLNLRFVYLM